MAMLHEQGTIMDTEEALKNPGIYAALCRVTIKYPRIYTCLLAQGFTPESLEKRLPTICTIQPHNLFFGPIYESPTTSSNPLQYVVDMLCEQQGFGLVSIYHLNEDSIITHKFREIAKDHPQPKDY